MARRKLHRLLWAALVAVLVVVGVRTFVGDVYRIDSSSMEPECPKNAYVFVLHDGSAPERFDLVVARHGDEFVVKRAVGIGAPIGEEVRIDGGDLRINGRPLPAEAPRPAPVLLFDDRLLAIEDHFNFGDVWSRDAAGALVLDAREVQRGANAGLLRFQPGRVSDGYLSSDGHLVQGDYDVADALVEVEFVALEPGGRVRAVLIEQGDAFEFAVDLSEEGMARAELRREGTSADAGVLEETLVPFEVGVPILMRFSNIDDHLSVDWIPIGGGSGGGGAGPPVAQATYERNAPDPLRPRRLGHSRIERVQVGGEGCRLELRHLRIYRDVHWTDHGERAVGRDENLQPDEVFLLGDNSAASQDSRHFGPVRCKEILGRPVLVVWPPSAIRRVR